VGIDASKEKKRHDGTVYAYLGGAEGVSLVYKQFDTYIPIRDWERELVHRDQDWWQYK
jgi:hypothetical protein|tara:strand:+ start:5730 stop:5903 length:174 start_codon:yes stop_codon:yes gene_type:complete